MPQRKPPDNFGRRNNYVSYFQSLQIEILSSYHWCKISTKPKDKHESDLNTWQVSYLHSTWHQSDWRGQHLSSKTGQCFDPPVQQGNPLAGRSKNPLSLLLCHPREQCQRLHLVNWKSNPPSVTTHIRGQAKVTHWNLTAHYSFTGDGPHRAGLAKKVPEVRCTNKSHCGVTGINRGSKFTPHRQGLFFLYMSVNCIDLESEIIDS